MNIEEIFNKIANHMLEGIEFHDQICRCYYFIGILKYAKDHEQHYFEESKYYRSLLRYYSSHYHRLLKIENIMNPKIIPESWFKYSSTAVDLNTKQKTIKELTNKWVEWEHTTKKLYQDMYCEAISIKEVAAATYINKLIENVSKELKHAEQLLIDLESIGYDMPTIITRR